MATWSPELPAGRLARASSLRAHLFALPDLSERPYSEALFTTFNVDLGYFEGHVLGPARAAGAAVTVVVDGAQYEPDPLAVHGAGSSYVVGVVDLPRAFHPKVTVLVGSDRVFLAVGSGNLTTGGWLGNDETLFVAQGSRDTGVPAVAGDVAMWLATIETLRISQAGRAGIVRTREALEHLLASTDVIDTGHELVTTSSGPILDQLPGDAAQQLLLHAPFHDHSGAALDALLTKYRPQHLAIAVQPRRTILNPDTLSAVARAHGVALTWHDAGGAYRHGKLIEAVAGEHRWVLVGSPNLTGAALLRGLATGGNCEVGVVATSQDSLYPGEGRPLEPSSIPAQYLKRAPGEDAPSAAPPPVLLGATLDEDGAIIVELARPAQVPVTVEISEYDDLPEVTTFLGSLPRGATGGRLLFTRPAGARSRIRITYGIEGAWRHGPFHFLADPSAVLRRIHAHRTSSIANTDVDWQAIFGDPALLQDWTRTLDKVTREQRATPATAVTHRSGGRVTAPVVPGARLTFDDDEAWAQYSDDAVARLGATLAHEASGGLILPHLASPTESRVPTGNPIWTDRFDADESDFDDSTTAEEVDDSADVDADVSSPADLVTAGQRHRFRTWIRDICKDLDQRPMLDRMAIARLVLIASLAPVWDEDAQWFGHLRDATEALTIGVMPARLAPEAGAVACVCVHRLDRGAAPDRRTGTGLQYVQLVHRLRPLIEAPDAERITRIVHSIYGSSPVSTHPHDVIDQINGVLDGNPWPEIVESIDRSHPEWHVNLDSEGRISITARSGAHFGIAGQALGLVPPDLTIGLRVTAGKQAEERWYARHHGVLVIQDKLGPRLVWKSYRLGPLVSPAGIQGSADMRSKAQIDPPPWRGISPTVRAVLEATGIDAD